MGEDKLNRLPPDVKKQFLKLALKLSEKKTKSKVHDDFLSFVKHVWPEFIEGKHHKEIAQKFNQIAKGEIKRLIINMPPRHTKSEFASFLLPSWMVGRRPNLKIIQTTHTTELAIRFGRKAKTLMDSPEYKQVFSTRLREDSQAAGKLDLEKTVKLRVNGKQNRAVNIMQPVLVQRSRAVVRTYLLSMTHTLSKMHLI